MTDKQFLELLEKYGKEIRDAILAGIREIRDSARLSEIVRLIEQGNIDGVLRALGYNPAVFNAYYLTLVQAFQEGGLAVVATFPQRVVGSDGIGFRPRFNIRNRSAEQWLNEHSSTLITKIEEDVRFVTRSTLQEGMREGRNPRTTALDLVGRFDRQSGHRVGGLIGLSERELAWVRSARRKLTTLDPSYFDMTLRDKRFDGIVRRAISEGRPLSNEDITRLVGRYSDNALRERGNSIARTETLSAISRSGYEATRQSLERGGFPPAAARKIWDSAGDERVRTAHKLLDETSVGIDEPFVSPITQNRMMHPHDTSLDADGRDVIGCRCRLRYDVNWAYNLK